MILDGMELSPDGHELADDYETEDQSELAHYAAWVTIENERLRTKVERLREALDLYRNGYQGACMACEPVGEENQRLLAEVEEARESIQSLREDRDYYKRKFEQPKGAQ